MILSQMLLYPIFSKFAKVDLYNAREMNYIESLCRDVYGPDTDFTEDLIAKDIFLPGFEIGLKEPYYFTKKFV